MYKASKHHSRGAQEEIGALTALERTNWLVPQLSAEYRSDFRAMQGHYNRAGQGLDKERWREVRDHLSGGLNALKLAVYSWGDDGEGIPKDPCRFGKQPELNRAAEFIDDLNGHIAEREAESELEEDIMQGGRR